MKNTAGFYFLYAKLPKISRHVLLGCSVGIGCTLCYSAPIRPAGELEHGIPELQKITVTVASAHIAEEENSHLAAVSQTRAITMGSLDLGVALKNNPGVNAQEFGAISRPVIRGQNEPRVKVSSNGTPVTDASDLSPDHAVTVSPMLTRAITVIKGPEVLMYQPGAVGGIVDIEGNEIPVARPKNRLSGTGALRYDTAGNNFEQLITTDAALTANWLLHADFLHNNAGDYNSPVSGQNTVAGTQNKLKTGALGLSYLYDSGVLGMAYREISRDYGIPGHNHEYDSCHPDGNLLHCGSHTDEAGGETTHDHEHSAGEAPPTLDMNSRRYELLWKHQLTSHVLKEVKLNANHTLYEHQELDGSDVMSNFNRKATSVALDTLWQFKPDWAVHAGYQGGQDDLDVTGEESYLPYTKTTTNGVYAFTRYDRDSWNILLSGRYDHKKITPQNSDLEEYRHYAGSVSGAWSWNFYPSWTLGASIGQVKRLPHVQELYADGVHLASNTYEEGNPGLKPETANQFEFNLSKSFSRANIRLSLYQHRINDYIYAQTLDAFESFRLIRYEQQDARFNGGELSATYLFNEKYELGLFADRVRGTFNAGDNVPRMPADRIGLRGHYHHQRWNASLDWARVFGQDHISDYESDTPGYYDLDASISYLVKNGAGVQYRLFVEGRNLTDAVRYNSASYLANVVPLPGRHFGGGIQVRF